MPSSDHQRALQHRTSISGGHGDGSSPCVGAGPRLGGCCGDGEACRDGVLDQRRAVRRSGQLQHRVAEV